MPETITINLPDENVRKEMDAALQKYRKQVNDTPALTSLLYDIDLLPEQIRLPVNITRMIAVCELFKVLTEEQIGRLFTNLEAA